MTTFLRVLIGAALAALALTSSATASEKSSKLVVRGIDTVVDGPCPAGVCQITLTDGAFRGTTGTGAYTGSIKLAVAAGFPNGEGGVCAPIEGEIVLGAGTPNRLVLALSGDSCQDGAGDVPRRRSPVSPTSWSSTAPGPTPGPVATASRRSPKVPTTANT